MKPEEMERQEQTRNVFNLIVDVCKEYKSLAWRNLDEKTLIGKIQKASEEFLEARKVAEAPKEPEAPTLEVPAEVVEEVKAEEPVVEEPATEEPDKFDTSDLNEVEPAIEASEDEDASPLEAAEKEVTEDLYEDEKDEDEIESDEPQQ